MKQKKVLLIKIGNINQPDPKINQDTISELVKTHFNIYTCYINKIPSIDEHFIVNSDLLDDFVFKCIRCDGKQIKSKVDDHEYIIFASWIRRLSYVKDKEYINKLNKFR
ncbi:TPA: hypothetical protein ACX6SN_003834 [Photobacterium damselae]